MNYLWLWRDEFDVLYNCSAYSYDEWASFGKPNKLVGTIYMTMGFTYEIIYIPFLFIMVKSEFLRLSCYKLMFLLGLIDITCMPLASICYGYLAFNGIVFCQAPTFVYTIGCIALSMWAGACSTCTILAMNRSLDIVAPHYARKIFEGKKTLIVMMLPIIYISYYLFFACPIIFNTEYYAAFFDPYIGTPFGAAIDIEEKYPHLVHTTNNICVVFIITGAYGFLCIALTVQYRGAHSVRLSKMQRQTFIQSSLICTFVTSAAIIYVYMQFFPTPMWVVVMGQIVWQCSHGATGIIYLTLNPTMRKAAIKFYTYPFKKAAGISIVPTTSTLFKPENNTTRTYSSTY
uniref:Serpentine Receptor, class T n=1 Tax=Panagrellus redivivus TaxID=6233 RepID=A0A7E4ZUN6_PANRE